MQQEQDRLGRVLNNIFDLIIIMVRIGVNYMVELWRNLSWIWKEDIPPHLNEEVKMWNGGDTFQEEEDVVKITESPNDGTSIDEMNIIYDGMMGEIQDDNG